MPGPVAIADLLRERIGLNPTLLRPEALRAVAGRRAATLGLRDEADYPGFVAGHPEEFQELVEEVVVSETWFFRDVQPFECLRWFVRGRASAETPLRLLSVPCGSGEEPFSMAMALLEAGRPPDSFRIEAADLSGRAIGRAAGAVYGKGAFREDSALTRACQGFFLKEDDGSRVCDEVRRCVHFRQANLLDGDFLRGEAGFDVIFCRNLIIYLTDEARRKALAALARLLRPGGMVYFGHAEGRAGGEGVFRTLTHEYPFAMTPRSDPGPKPPERPAPVSRSRVKLPPARPPARELPAAPVVSRAESLADAVAAADQGRLDDAAAVCERLLRERAPSPDVLCLLGVVRQAQGREEARQCFDRALYLDPGHLESLIHLTLLAEAGGDARQAAQYRRRAERVKAGGPT
jgi:chemotaxis protein methyltransferase WspC